MVVNTAHSLRIRHIGDNPSSVGIDIGIRPFEVGYMNFRGAQSYPGSLILGAATDRGSDEPSHTLAHRQETPGGCPLIGLDCLFAFHGSSHAI